MLNSKTPSNFSWLEMTASLGEVEYLSLSNGYQHHGFKVLWGEFKYRIVYVLGFKQKLPPVSKLKCKTHPI